MVALVQGDRVTEDVVEGMEGEGVQVSPWCPRPPGHACPNSVVLANASTCQEALATFQDAAGARTLEDQGVDFGLHWESDQNIVTARLLRCHGSSVP